MTPWFTIRNHADTADVEITGEIRAGDGHRFIAALPSSARTIRLRVSSPGGDATSAMQITHALKGHRARVEVTIAKLAASAATLPIMAADRVRIGADAVGMLHNPRLVPQDIKTPREARELRAAADELDRLKDQMLTVYGWRLKPARAELAQLLDATTWLDAAEAVRLGLADEIAHAEPAVTARFDPHDLAQLGTVPPRFAGRIAALGGSPSPIPRFNVLETYDRLNQRGVHVR